MLCLPHIGILLVTVIKPVSAKALQVEFSNRNAFQSWCFLSPHIVDGLCLKNFVFPLSSQWAILSLLKHCKFLMMYGSDHIFFFIVFALPLTPYFFFLQNSCAFMYLVFCLISCIITIKKWLTEVFTGWENWMWSLVLPPVDWVTFRS